MIELLVGALSALGGITVLSWLIDRRRAPRVPAEAPLLERRRALERRALELVAAGPDRTDVALAKQLRDEMVSEGEMRDGAYDYASPALIARARAALAEAAK